MLARVEGRLRSVFVAVTITPRSFPQQGDLASRARSPAHPKDKFEQLAATYNYPNRHKRRNKGCQSFFGDGTGTTIGKIGARAIRSRQKISIRDWSDANRKEMSRQLQGDGQARSAQRARSKAQGTPGIAGKGLARATGGLNDIP